MITLLRKLLSLSKLQEDIQSKFECQFASLELEIRKRDEIISQLQARIQELEQREIRTMGDSGDSTEPDISIEEDLVEDREDHPFMRDGSVDTVLTAQTRYRRSPHSTESSYNRRSWEEHSEEETLELQDLPRSMTPQSLWKEDVAIDLESNSEGSNSENEDEGTTCRSESEDEDENKDEEGHNNWEVVMLAEELETRRRSSESSSPGS